MQWIVHEGHLLESGDLKTALVSGEPDPAYKGSDALYIDPPSDLKRWLNLGPEDVLRLRKAVYGLNNTPLRWQQRLSRALRHAGFVSLQMDPCVWILPACSPAKHVSPVDVPTKLKTAVADSSVSPVPEMYTLSFVLVLVSCNGFRCKEIHSCRLPLESCRADLLGLNIFIWLSAADPAWANRPEGSSTSGHVIMAAHPNILRGESSTVSVLAWNSRKIRQVLRSSLGAKCAAFSTGLENMDMFRVLYGQLCGDVCDLAEYETYLQKTNALCVNDCKSLADALLAAGSAASKTSEDKRFGIELSMIKQRLSRNETRFQWVEGSSQG